MKLLNLKIKKHFTRIGVLSVVLCTLIPVQSVSAQKMKSKQAAISSLQQNIVLADKGMSLYRIIIPSAPTSNEQKAANVLQDYLLQITGAAIPIISVNKSRSPYEIVLGQNERLNELATKINFTDLKADGFVIKTDSLRLIIAGGNIKGTLYGVYTFLEKYLGCRMYTPTAKIIPKLEQIILGKINDIEVPGILFRTTHYKSTWDAEYIDWHKLSHGPNGERNEWGLWVHTFNRLLPPDVYYRDHPEYYALINGSRIPTQLCLTNPNVLKLVIQNLRKEIAKNPEALYWSVSQNDNRDHCMCEECQKLDNQEGSPSGSITNFVNQVAVKFPDKIISTLAYNYSRKAPKNIRPVKNVNIMLCSIESYRDIPLAQATDSSGKDFVRDIENWGKIANDIIVWDYVIQFSNLISPFPNLHVLQPNLQFFVEHGVNAMFEQGNNEIGGEFAELRSYMISKLLWDPYANADTVMNDFLNGYYGAAGKFIRKYIDIMREALLTSGKPLRIFSSPNDAATSYLTPSLIDKYNDLFNQAESSVAVMPEILERVRIARLPLQYAIMEQAKMNYTGDNGLFVKIDGKWVVRKDIRSMIDPFTDLCIRQGVTRLKEWCITPEAYRSDMYRLFFKGMNEHLAYRKKVKIISPDSTKIQQGSDLTLTDGKRGSCDYYLFFGHESGFHWFSFSGQDLDIVIDLEKVQKVRHIESAFYQIAHLKSVLPKKVEYFLSLDGKDFIPAGVIENNLPINQNDAYQRDFITDFEPHDARYVRVKARTIGNMPESHPVGGGQPAMMHIDEIVVE
jgi:hypothetical protein